MLVFSTVQKVYLTVCNKERMAPVRIDERGSEDYMRFDTVPLHGMGSPDLINEHLSAILHVLTVASYALTT
jgi:hypothetical protein